MDQLLLTHLLLTHLVYAAAANILQTAEIWIM